MKKVFLADKAEDIHRLTSLVDWASLGLESLGTCTNGLEAASLIHRLKPDLVIVDIDLPGLSWLELLHRYSGISRTPKFILLSEREDFHAVRAALSGGAVDFLLKPVSVEDLTQAICKAQTQMADSSTAALFRQASVPLCDFFSQLTANRDLIEANLNQNFASLLGGKDSAVFYGLCFGLSQEAEYHLEQLPYERQLFHSFSAFNCIRDELEHSGYGCFLRKDERRCCMLGIFSSEEAPEVILRQAIEKTAEKTGCRLRVGVGRRSIRADELEMTYEDALRAFDLYYFEQSDILHWNGTPHLPSFTNEEFDAAVRQVFHSIVVHADTVEEDVDRVLDIISDLHYNNRNAAYGRVMIFTGDLCQELYSSRLLTGSFTQRQDALQHMLEGCNTYSEMRACLQRYYRDILPSVYRTASKKNTAEIYKVQQYIQEHYREELSLKTLSEVVCVSPHYFSAYFKAETGQNYKAYLTQVRMEHAMRLVLNTDLKTYELAEQVGYNNVRRFVDAFRATYGMSPADCRKLRKIEP